MAIRIVGPSPKTEHNLRNDDVYPEWKSYTGPSFIGIPTPSAAHAALLRSRLRGLIYGTLIAETYGSHQADGLPSWGGNGFQEMLLALDGLLRSGGLVVPQDFACRLRYWSRFGFPELANTSASSSASSITSESESSSASIGLDSAAEAAEHIAASDAFVAYPTRVSESLRHTQTTSYFAIRSMIVGVVKFWSFSHVLENAKALCKTTHASHYSAACAVAAAIAVAAILQKRQSSEGIAIASIRDVSFEAADHELSTDAVQRYRRGFKLVDEPAYKALSAAFEVLSAGQLKTLEEKLAHLNQHSHPPQLSAARAFTGGLFGVLNGFESLPQNLIRHQLSSSSSGDLIQQRVERLEALLGIAASD